MIHTFEVEVTRTQTVKVTIDDEKFTAEEQADFEKHFYKMEKGLESHAEHLAWSACADMVGSNNFIEGYGPVTLNGNPPRRREGEIDLGITVSLEGKEEVEYDVTKK